ncbi:unnamed protein product [Closterium sp. NIES-53]
MASRTLVSGLPRSLPPLPPGPAPTCVPYVEGRQRAAPHSSSFPPTEAPLQTLHMDVKGEVPEVLIDWIRDRGGEFFSDLLRAFCRAEGICQTSTVPTSPHHNGIAERRIGMVMDVARTPMIHAAAPHFLWPFAVQYAAHQINLQPHVSLPETTPTLRWTGKVGDVSAFRVWGSRAFVRDTTADKLSSRAVPCVFLGFPPDAPGWLSSQDVTFDESVSYYRLFPYRTAFLPPLPLFLAPGTPPVDPLPPQGPAPSGVSQVDPAEPVEVAVDLGDARSGEPAGAGTGGAEPECVEPWGAESWGAESGRIKPGGVAPGHVEPEDTASGGAEPARAESGGALGVPSRREPLSPYRGVLSRGVPSCLTASAANNSHTPPTRSVEWLSRRLKRRIQPRSHATLFSPSSSPPLQLPHHPHPPTHLALPNHRPPCAKPQPPPFPTPPPHPAPSLCYHSPPLPLINPPHSPHPPHPFSALAYHSKLPDHLSSFLLSLLYLLSLLSLLSLLHPPIIPSLQPCPIHPHHQPYLLRLSLPPHLPHFLHPPHPSVSPSHLPIAHVQFPHLSLRSTPHLPPLLPHCLHPRGPPPSPPPPPIPLSSPSASPATRSSRLISSSSPTACIAMSPAIILTSAHIRITIPHRPPSLSPVPPPAQPPNRPNSSPPPLPPLPPPPPLLLPRPPCPPPNPPPLPHVLVPLPQRPCACALQQQRRLL